MDKYLKVISWFLGISIFLTGVLKFVDPFQTWYAEQIVGSGMGMTAHALGLIGEIGMGAMLLFALIFKSRLSPKVFSEIVIVGSAGIVVMMIAASYVHLQPAVPAAVLPLGIKPPLIPGFFLLLAAINIWLCAKQAKENT